MTRCSLLCAVLTTLAFGSSLQGCKPKEEGDEIVGGTGSGACDPDVKGAEKKATDNGCEGMLADGKDGDTFEVIGEDGKRGLEIEVENTGVGPDAPVITVLLTTAHDGGNREVEGFEVARGATERLTIGSRVQQKFYINLSSPSGATAYRVKAGFVDEPYEREVVGSNQIAADEEMFGRLRTGKDEDPFTVVGADGKGGLTVTIDDLGEGPADSEITATITTVYDGGTRLLETFTIGHGLSESLTIGSAVDRMFVITLRAAAGPVPYRIHAAFVDDVYHTELENISNKQNRLESGAEAYGRLASGSDADSFALTAGDVGENLNVSVENMADSADAAAIDVVISSSNTKTTRVTFTVPVGKSAQMPIASMTGETFTIMLSAKQGPVPYRVQATFE